MRLGVVKDNQEIHEAHEREREATKPNGVSHFPRQILSCASCISWSISSLSAGKSKDSRECLADVTLGVVKDNHEIHEAHERGTEETNSNGLSRFPRQILSCASCISWLIVLSLSIRSREKERITVHRLTAM